MLIILRPPHSLRTAHDTLCEKTALGICRSGVPCVLRDLWPESMARAMRRHAFPLRRRLFNWGPARVAVAGHLRRVGPGDVVLVSGPAILNRPKPSFCVRLKRKGASYVFHMLDDWFSVADLKPIAEARIPLADLVVVPTPGIRDQIHRFFRKARVEVLEEPVDVVRLQPSPAPPESGPPLIVWCGGGHSQADLDAFGWIFEELAARVPFRLRIITGVRRPDLRLPVRWEWRPYDYAREREDLAGAVAGLAPLQMSLYASCKGTYKVKTYMACGVPPVASPVGHSLRMIRPGENGFMPSTREEWMETLLRLISDEDFARRVSAQARRDAVEKYSHDALMPVWAARLGHHFPQLRTPRASP